MMKTEKPQKGRTLEAAEVVGVRDLSEEQLTHMWQAAQDQAVSGRPVPFHFYDSIRAALSAPAAPTEAVQRVQAYIERREQARQLHQESIHSFDLGPDTGVELLLSDLKSLVKAPAAQSEPTDERLSNQLATWRKEVARLNDLIATATSEPNASNSSSSSEAELPPLPEPDTHCFDEDEETDVWSHSSGQMQAYARDAVMAEREACAQVCITKTAGTTVALVGIGFAEEIRNRK